MLCLVIVCLDNSRLQIARVYCKYRLGEIDHECCFLRVVFSAIYLQSYRHGGEEWEVEKASGGRVGTYGSNEELAFSCELVRALKQGVRMDSRRTRVPILCGSSL